MEGVDGEFPVEAVSPDIVGRKITYNVGGGFAAETLGPFAVCDKVVGRDRIPICLGGGAHPAFYALRMLPHLRLFANIAVWKSGEVRKSMSCELLLRQVLRTFAAEFVGDGVDAIFVPIERKLGFLPARVGSGSGTAIDIRPGRRSREFSLNVGCAPRA